MIFALVAGGRLIGESLREVNRRRRSRRGIRVNFHRLADRSRTLNASEFYYTPARVLA